MERDLTSRTAVLETNDKNIFHQLDEIKTDVREIRRLATLCETISARLAGAQEKLTEMEHRLSALESKDGEEFRHYKRSAIVHLVCGVVAAILASVGISLGNG